MLIFMEATVLEFMARLSSDRGIKMIGGISMKAKIAVFVLFLILLPFSVSFAEEETNANSGREPVLKIPNLSGEISFTGQSEGVTGNPSKYYEYRDNHENHFLGGIKLKYDDDKYWFYFKAEDIGYDTQHYKLEGGVYGIVKYDLEYNEIPHIYSLGNKTIYNGSGTNSLTTIPGYVSLPASRWNPLDYSIDRQQEGGGFRLDVLNPFYVEFSVNRETRNGTRPISVTNNNQTSPIVEMPQPIDYVTEVVKGEIGYIAEPVFASAFIQYTDFTNNNQDLYFQNVYTGNNGTRLGQTDTLSLPPNNQNYNYGFKGSVELPFHTRLNVSLAGSDTTSDTRYLTSSVISTDTTVNPSYRYTYANGSDTWHGKTDSQNYNFVLTSHPISGLSYSLFYKYDARQNKSDNPESFSSINDGASGKIFPVSYYKSNLGADVSYKLPAHFILNGGYNYEIAHNSVEVKTYTIPTTADNIWKVGLKWAGVSFMSAKVGYERMNRSGSNDYSSEITDIYHNTYLGGALLADKLAPYKNLFDTGSQNRDKIKTRVSFFPVETLDIGLGYNYKKSTYPDAIIGLQNSRSNEYYADAGYTFGKYAKLNGYIAYEDLSMYSFMRVCASPTTTTNYCSPSSPTQNASNYNFDFTLTDRSFDYGVGLDVYVIPQKVTLRLQFDSVKSDGGADYTILNQAALSALGVPTAAIPTGLNNSNIDIPGMDLYRKNTLLAKVMWNVTPDFMVTVGYANEHYHYDDFGYNNYPVTYTMTDSSGIVSYLTGMYSNPSYNTNLAFLTLKYSFK